MCQDVTQSVRAKLMTYFELVNLSSGNRIGEFDSEEAALRDVRDVVQQRGPKAIAAIALTQEDDQGNGKILAEGDELARRAAHSAVAAQPSAVA